MSRWGHILFKTRAIASVSMFTAIMFSPAERLIMRPAIALDRAVAQPPHLPLNKTIAMTIRHQAEIWFGYQSPVVNTIADPDAVI